MRSNCVSNRKIWIIGNAQEVEPITNIVAADDIVVRFNNPNSSCPLQGNILYVANGAWQTENLKINRDHLTKVQKIIFRYSPERILTSSEFDNTDRDKHLLSFTQMIKTLRKDVPAYDFLSENLFGLSRQELHLHENDPSIPSTGILAIFDILSRSRDIKLILHNFTFEGWRGHPWEAEKAYVNKLVNAGLVEFL